MSIILARSIFFAVIIASMVYVAMDAIQQAVMYLPH